jgi:hypothetical protein
MGSVPPLLSFLLVIVSGWVHRHQLLVIVRIGDREANALVFVPVVPSYSDGVLVNDGDSCRA